MRGAASSFRIEASGAKGGRRSRPVLAFLVTPPPLHYSAAMTSSDADALVHDWPLALGYESRDITASDGTVLRLVLAGPPSAPPVVLLHGAPQHAYEWRKVIPLLTDRFRVI